MGRIRDFFRGGEKEGNAAEQSGESSTDYQELLEDAKGGPDRIEVKPTKLERLTTGSEAQYAPIAVEVVHAHTEAAETLAEVTEANGQGVEAKAIIERAKGFIQAEADVALVDVVRQAGKETGEVAGHSLEVRRGGAKQSEALASAIEQALQSNTTEAKMDGTANPNEFWTTTETSDSKSAELDDRIEELAQAISFIRRATGFVGTESAPGDLGQETLDVKKGIVENLKQALETSKSGATRIELGLDTAVVIRVGERQKGSYGTETSYGASVITTGGVERRQQAADAIAGGAETAPDKYYY